MARAVKKKELSQEEKLAAALVPEEEQPYKVPENWCWVKITNINKYDSKVVINIEFSKYYIKSLQFIGFFTIHIFISGQLLHLRIVLLAFFPCPFYYGILSPSTHP